MQNISAVYSITNTTTNHRYIGSAINFRKRKNTHLSLLKKGKHFNRPLQNAWNKYKEGSFEFTILECVPNAVNLISFEQKWIDLLRPRYNIRRIADSNFGTKRSLETKAKMSLARMGRKNSPETRKKLSDFHKGRVIPPAQREKMIIGIKNSPNAGKFKKGWKFWLGKKRNKQIRTMLINNGRKQFSKEVLDTSTGLLYPSLVDACKVLGYKYSTVSNYFRPYKINKTTLVYTPKH